MSSDNILPTAGFGIPFIFRNKVYGDLPAGLPIISDQASVTYKVDEDKLFSAQIGNLMIHGIEFSSFSRGLLLDLSYDRIFAEIMNVQITMADGGKGIPASAEALNATIMNKNMVRINYPNNLDGNVPFQLLALGVTSNWRK